jgi:hypothetical protein
MVLHPGKTVDKHPPMVERCPTQVAVDQSPINCHLPRVKHAEVDHRAFFELSPFLALERKAKNSTGASKY